MTTTTTSTKTYPTFPTINPNLYSYKIIKNNNQLPDQEENLVFLQDKSTITTTIPTTSINPPPDLRSSTQKEDDTKVDDFTKRELLLLNILDKIAPKYEEIKNLLSHVPEPNKTQILGGIISRAVFSDNPIRYINNQLKDLRKAKLYSRMLADASVFLGIDKQATKEYLKMGLKEDAID
jgi:uncharacterized protein YeeX (DUF496 family)